MTSSTSGAGAAAKIPRILAALRVAHPDARYELDWETPEQLLVATILAAQSTDVGVNKVTKDLFQHLPDARAFADVDTGVLEEAIKPCGLNKMKAKQIQGAMRAIVEEHGGKIPQDLDAMTKLPGVGRKTAHVVLQTAFKMPTGIIVDTHVTRISPRIGLTTKDEPDDIEQDLLRIVPQDQWTFFGPAMVLHGRYTCKAKKPQCEGCPIRDVCDRNGVSE